jgi:predicted ArsR family transcriptional regulator
MPPIALPDDLIPILRKIKENGGTDCSGSCHHRKPGEFHCHAIAQELKISSSGVKRRILDLVRLGMLERNRLDREGTYYITKFTVTLQGEQALQSLGGDSHQ